MRGAIVVVCVAVGSMMMMGIGFAGIGIGEERAKARRFSREKAIIARELAADFPSANLDVDMYTEDGTAILVGDVRTKGDYDRLHSRMLELFGRSRVDELMKAVSWP